MKINDKISNALLISSIFIENLGLLNGKMGIAIYFFHSARCFNDNIYLCYAERLLDEIYNEISTSTPKGIENGLAGICWGVEYLFEHNFIEESTDEVLEEIDEVLIKEFEESNNTLSEKVGYGFYFLKRYKNSPKHFNVLSDLLSLVEKEKQTLIYALHKEVSFNEKNINTIESSVWLYVLIIRLLSEYVAKGIIQNINDLLLFLLDRSGDIVEKSKSQLINLVFKYVFIRILYYDSGSIMSKQRIDEILKSFSNINRLSLINEVESYNESKSSIVKVIVLAYQRLFIYTKYFHFFEESKFWIEKNNSIYEDHILTNLDLSYSTKDLGIIYGLSGIGLLNLFEHSFID